MSVRRTYPLVVGVSSGGSPHLLLHRVHGAHFLLEGCKIAHINGNKELSGFAKRELPLLTESAMVAAHGRYREHSTSITINSLDADGSAASFSPLAPFLPAFAGAAFFASASVSFTGCFFAVAATNSVYTSVHRDVCPNTNSSRAMPHTLPWPPSAVDAALSEAYMCCTTSLTTASGQGCRWKSACIASSHRENHSLRVFAQ
jgi:hypothetical protein